MQWKEMFPPDRQPSMDEIAEYIGGDANKLDSLMEAVLPKLSPDISELYRQAGDYMKLGKWIVFRINDASGVEDYKNIISVKMLPKFG